MRLLIFDDDQVLTCSNKRLLSPHFERVMTANNIEDALMLLDEADVVMSDYHAPSHFDGEEMVNACKMRNKPVVVFSALPPQHLGVMTLTKPADLDSILRAIRAVV